MRAMLIALAILLSGAVWAVDKVQTLNVKTGLWETTATTTSSGQVPIPAGLLERLSPEQRAMFEEKMKANAGEKTKTHVAKSCLTKEKLQRGMTFGEDKDCTQKVLTSTSTKQELQVTCQGEGMKSSGTVLIEAVSPENTKGSGHMTMTAGERTMNVNNTFSAKWLGPDCGNMK